MISEHCQVVLKVALPALQLEPGDVGFVVHVHAQNAAYEVEFTSVDGRTLGVETVLASQLREASGSAAPHERECIGGVHVWSVDV